MHSTSAQIHYRPDNAGVSGPAPGLLSVHTPYAPSHPRKRASGASARGDSRRGRLAGLRPRLRSRLGPLPQAAHSAGPRTDGGPMPTRSRSRRRAGRPGGPAPSRAVSPCARRCRPTPPLPACRSGAGLGCPKRRPAKRGTRWFSGTEGGAGLGRARRGGEEGGLGLGDGDEPARGARVCVCEMGAGGEGWEGGLRGG